jgi:hypothetical protein
MELRPLCLVLSVSLLSAACAPYAAPPSMPAPHVILAEATPAAATPPASTDKGETADERHSRHGARRLGWIFVGAGAVAGVVALGTSYYMLTDKSTRDSDCSGMVCSTAGLTANGQLRDLGPWNMAAWVIAAAGLGAGAFLLLTNPADSSQQTAVGVTPNGSGAGLTLRRSF